jgi:hypothetical protein
MRVKRIAARWKTLPPMKKCLRRRFLENAFCEVFSLDLEGAALEVHDFGNVWPGGFSPARFSDFKESLEEFSALTWGTRMGEFRKRRQARLGMRDGWR